MPRPKGTPKTGGRQSGVRNKIGADVRDAARRYTQQAIDVLADIMASPTEPGIVRVKAAEVLLDRGFGKPPQATDLHVSGAGVPGPTRIEIVAGPIDPAKMPTRPAHWGGYAPQAVQSQPAPQPASAVRAEPPGIGHIPGL